MGWDSEDFSGDNMIGDDDREEDVGMLFEWIEIYLND
jgi:hypothetical protein